MEKQDLLNIVSSYSSFIKDLLDEYREEWVYKREDTLTNLLNDVMHDVSSGIIPVSLYERIIYPLT